MRKIFSVVFFIVCLSWSTDAFGCKPVVNLTDTITFCKGSAVTVSAANPNTTYIWSTGATTASISISTTGLYWVAATNVCGTTRDSIYVSVHEPLLLNLGPDRTVCSSPPFVITPPYQPGYTYLWHDGSTANTFTVTQAGKHYVKITNSCGSYSDTVNFTLESPVTVNLGSDIYKCDNQPVTINSGLSGTNVIWSTGQTASSIQVNSSGIYSATVMGACGSVTDSIEVTYSPGLTLDLGDTVSLCTGGSVTLSTNSTTGSSQWSTGATTSSINVNSAGTYWVKYTDQCGIFHDTVHVILTGPAQVDLGPDTVICSNASLVLDAGFPGSNYIWNNGSRSQTITITEGGSYWVGVDNGCGYQYDTIQIDTLRIPYSDGVVRVGFCAGSSTVVDARHWIPNASYLWDDASTSPTNTFSTSGNHWVWISNACGADTFHISVEQDFPLVIDLGPADTICDTNKIYNIEAVVQSSDSIYWSNTGRTAIAKYSTTGIHWVSVTNACGTYTDSVYLASLKAPITNLPEKVSICGNNSRLLQVPKQILTSFLWSNGDTSRVINVSQPGIYWVRAQNNCDTIMDTVEVIRDFPISLDLGPDVVLCEPAFKLLDVSGLGADSIHWSTGSSNTMLPVFSTGTYWVELTNACGVYRDTINIVINKLPRKKLKDIAFCSNSNFTLDVTQNTLSSYLWNTGDTSASISGNTGGWYYVDITNGCGTIRDSAYVQMDNFLSSPQLEDTVYCKGGIVIDPGHIPGVSYLWSNGSSQQKLTVNQSGTYWLRMRNSCNTVYDTINVLVTGPPTEVLGEEVRFCSGTLLSLNAQNPGSTYLWHDGSTSQTKEISSTGKYWCTITNDCGEITDTVRAIVEYPLQPDLGNDTLICQGNSLTLSTGYTEENHTWQNGSTDTNFIVTQTGLYHVKVVNSCGVYYDSIYVEVQDVPVFSLGNDTVICAIGGWLDLNGPDDMETYLWSNGSTRKETRFTAPGFYWLTVSNKCFSYTDTIFAKGEYPINLNLGPDTTLCMTETYSLSANVPGYTVYWEDGSTLQQREISRSGTYHVFAKNSCGTFRDTVRIQFDYILDPPVSDTAVCIEDSARFDLTEMPYEFEWFDGSRDEVRYFEEVGFYGLTIYNKCGVFEKDFEVSKVDCSCPLHVPNSFTPNGDGLNDVFRIGHACNLVNYRIEIFSRWGELLFSSEDDSAVWDGTDLKGRILPEGVYIYRLKYQWNVYDADRHKEEYGHISLIR